MIQREDSSFQLFAIEDGSVDVTEDAKGFFLTNSQVEMLRREADGFEDRLQALMEKRGF